MKVKIFHRWLPVVALGVVLVACTNVRTEPEVLSMTIQDTEWRLVKLLDVEMLDQDNLMRHPTLVFLPDGRVAGSDGCNRLMGGYHEQGQELHFTQLASTLMACVEGMETADKFNQLITEVRRYHLSEGVLELFSDSGDLLMRFHSEAATDGR